MVGQVDSSGHFQELRRGAGLSTGWDQLVPAGQTYILFYRSGTGDIALAEFVKGNLVQAWGQATDPGQILCGAENGVGVRFRDNVDPLVRSCISYGVRATPDTVKNPLVDLRGGPGEGPGQGAKFYGNFGEDVGSGWIYIVALGGPP